MDVHLDFFLYGFGVYERSHHVSKHVSGHHAVKLIFWGSENKVNYWVSGDDFFKKRITFFNLFVHISLLPTRGAPDGAKMATSGFAEELMSTKLNLMWKYVYSILYCR